MEIEFVEGAPLLSMQQPLVLHQVYRVSNVMAIAMDDTFVWICTASQINKCSLLGTVLNTYTLEGSCIELITASQGTLAVADRTGSIWLVTNELSSIPIPASHPKVPLFQKLLWMNDRLLVQLTTGQVFLCKNGTIMASFEHASGSDFHFCAELDFAVSVSATTVCIVSETPKTIEVSGPTAAKACIVSSLYVAIDATAVHSLDLNSWHWRKHEDSPGLLDITNCSLLKEPSALVLHKTTNAYCVKILKLVDNQLTQVLTAQLCGFEIQSLGNCYFIAQESVYKLDRAEGIFKFKGLLEARNYDEAVEYAKPYESDHRSYAYLLIKTYLETPAQPELITVLYQLKLTDETLAQIYRDILWTDTPRIHSSLQHVIDKTPAAFSQCIQELRALSHKLRSYLCVRSHLCPDKDQWSVFSISDLFYEIRSLCESGKIYLAIYLFDRHFADLPSLHRRVHEIVKAIPLNTPVEEYGSWLQTKVIPQLKKKYLEKLEQALVDRVLLAENTQSNSELAYKLTCIITDAPVIAWKLGLRSGTSSVTNPRSQARFSVSAYTPSAELLQFQRQLKELLTLQRHYCASISLSEMLSNRKLVLTKILDALEDESQIEAKLGHLLDLSRDYAIDLDEFLSDYILEVYQSHNKLTLARESAVIALLSHIQSPTTREATILRIYEYLPRPLPAHLRAIVGQVSNESCIVTELAENQQRKDELQSMLTEYSLPVLNMYDRRQVYSAFRHIVQMPQGYTQALRFTKVFDWLTPEDVQYHVIMSNIKSNRSLHHFADMIKEAKQKTLLRCFWECIGMLRYISARERYMTGLHNAYYLMTRIKGYEEHHTVLGNMQKLVKNYDLYLTFEDYADELLRQEVLLKFVTGAVQDTRLPQIELSAHKYSDKKRRTKDVNASSGKRKKHSTLSSDALEGLAHALVLSKNVLVVQLVQTALQQGRVSLAISYLKKFFTSPFPPAEIIEETVLKLAQQARKPTHLLQLAQLLSVGLSKRELHASPSLLNLLIRLKQAAWALQHTGSSEFYVQGFLEETMCLGTQTVMPLAKGHAVNDEESFSKLTQLLHRNGCLLFYGHLIQDRRLSTPQDVLKSSLVKVLNSRAIDYSFALGVTLGLGPELSKDVLEKASNLAGSDNTSSRIVGQLGYESSMIWNKHDQASNWSKFKTTAKWAQTLALLQIPCDLAQLNPNELPRAVFPYILEKTQDLTLCLDLCHEYNLPESEAKLAYIEYLLIYPVVKKKMLSLTDEELVTKCAEESPFDQSYMGKVTELASSLSDSSFLNLLTTRVLAKVAQIDYDRIGFIYKHLIRLNPTHTQYQTQSRTIQMLAKYQRVSAPTLEEWDNLSELSKYVSPEVHRMCTALHTVRLPLDLVLIETKHILQKELRLNNVEYLVSLGQSLHVEPTWFRATAIQNEFLHNHCPTDSCLQCPSVHTLEGAVRRIKEPKEQYGVLEAVTKSLQVSNYWLKLKQLQLVICEEWKRSANSVYLARIEERAAITERRVKTETIRLSLQSHNLSSDYLRLLKAPADLIKKLYFDLIPLVVAEETKLTQNELEAIVHTIAEQFDVNLDTVKYDILYQWLLEDSVERQNVAQAAHMQALSLAGTCAGWALLNNEVRVFYVVQRLEEDWVLEHLLKIATDVDSHQYSYKSRATALNVLLRLFGLELLQKHLDVFPVPNIPLFLQLCYYLADLQALKLHYDFRTLFECDKEIFCKSLLNNHYNEQRCVQLVAAICMDYMIVNKTIWRGILHSLTLAKAWVILLHIFEWLSVSGVYRKLQDSELEHSAVEVVSQCLNPTPAVPLRRLFELCIELDLPLILLVDAALEARSECLPQLALCGDIGVLSKLLAGLYHSPFPVTLHTREVTSREEVLDLMLQSPDLFRMVVKYIKEDFYRLFLEQLTALGRVNERNCFYQVLVHRGRTTLSLEEFLQTYLVSS